MPLKIHSIPMGLARAYLIESAAGLVLVDAGVPGCVRRVLSRMRAIDRRDLKLIYITHAHFDHYGSAAALRRVTGAPVAVHRADGEAMARGETHIGSGRGRGRMIQMLWPLLERHLQVEPTSPDHLFEDGDGLQAFGLQAVVLHTPGHTPGSSCLLVEGRIAFSGDLVFNHGWPHVQRLYATDWSSISGSLARLQAAAPEWVYAGHGRRRLSGAALQKLKGIR
jgi:hydroxyacylglutathione hydrolase